MATATAIFTKVSKGKILKPSKPKFIVGSIAISGGDYATSGLAVVDASGDSLEDHLGSVVTAICSGIGGMHYVYDDATHKILAYTGVATEHGVSAIADTVTFIAIGA